MEKNSTSICMIAVIAIATALVIPMPGIIAENDSTSKELQLCCSYIEEEDDSQDLLILNSMPKYHLSI